MFHIARVFSFLYTYLHFTFRKTAETPDITLVPPALSASNDSGSPHNEDAETVPIMNEANTAPVVETEITVNTVVDPTDAIFDTSGNARLDCGNQNWSDDDGDEDLLVARCPCPE